MPVQKIKILFLLLILAFAYSCDIQRTDIYERQYVAQAMLVAGAPLPVVQLNSTIAADTQYSYKSTAVSGAIVSIRLMKRGLQTGETFTYEESRPGKYVPVSSAIVQSLRTYELLITLPASRLKIQAQTFVPGRIKIASVIPDSVVYQENSLPVVHVMANHKQTVNLLTSYIAQKPYYHNMTPYYADQASQDTMSAYYDYNSNMLDLITPSDYTRNADSSLNINLSWLGFSYYGPYSIIIYSLDKNLYDLHRSTSIQRGGSTMPPGQMGNAIYHMEGGIGFLGSVATDTIYTFVRKPKK